MYRLQMHCSFLLGPKCCRTGLNNAFVRRLPSRHCCKIRIVPLLNVKFQQTNVGQYSTTRLTTMSMLNSIMGGILCRSTKGTTAWLDVAIKVVAVAVAVEFFFLFRSVGNGIEDWCCLGSNNRKFGVALFISFVEKGVVVVVTTPTNLGRQINVHYPSRSMLSCGGESQEVPSISTWQKDKKFGKRGGGHPLQR